MIRKRGSYPVEVIEKMRGGAGEFHIEHILSRPELGSAGRLFSWGTLKSGHSVGMHTHENDMEICCFVSGSGVVAEPDGTRSQVGPGDTNYVPKGASHEIINTGSEDLVYLACVLYPDGQPV
ncbi:cupin [Synergistales bacterium]|nr:cupin [Synergistales bacterium]